MTEVVEEPGFLPWINTLSTLTADQSRSGPYKPLRLALLLRRVMSSSVSDPLAVTLSKRNCGAHCQQE